MPTRISGKVYGDLTGSIFQPEVKSIANVNSGTLGIAYGGTGLTSVGTSGSALISNGSSLVYAPVASSGISGAEVTASFGLKGDISSSFIRKTDLTASTAFNSTYSTPAQVTASYPTRAEVSGSVVFAKLSGASFTGAITSSVGMSSSFYRLSDGTQLSSSTQIINTSVPITRGGTGLTSVGTSGSVLTSNGSSIVYAPVASGGGISSTGGTFTGPITSSTGGNFNSFDALFNRSIYVGQDTTVGAGGGTSLFGNIVFGQNAFRSNVNGRYNVALGYEALKSNTVGEGNIAIGTAMENNTTGSYNVAIGGGYLNDGPLM